jgi:Tol biopolymer transport system component
LVDFVTTEGTGMSVDVSPDGSWIVFDLLGHVYRMPIGGGEATAITQSSGPALNFHPAISPDGKRIAFISDRNGQLNVWTMGADGGDPRLVFGDPNTRFLSPAWAPDGKSIVAVRLYRSPGRAWHRQNRTLYRLPLGGGLPEPLIEEQLTQPDAPAFSSDGRHLYYHVSYSIAEGLGMLTAGYRILRRDMTTGQLDNVRYQEPAEPTPEFRAALLAGGYATDVGERPSATTPKPSPDGKWLAFSREMPDQTFEWRGHQMRPSTALWLRDLATGAEKVLLPIATKDLTETNAQYAYRPFPGYGWLADGTAIIISVGGKIQRLDLATGSLTPIPFTARVTRTLAEPARGRVTIDDDSLAVRFIQWPASSPDGSRLAFTAVGKIWVMDLPNGAPRPLTESMAPAFQLAATWSPDGQSVAFTTWDDAARGQLWVVPARGGPPRRVTTEPGEYLGPVWSPDGQWIAVTRGPGPGSSGWNPWDEPVGWTLVRVPVGGGAATVLAPIAAWTLAGIGPGGGLTFADQDHPGGSPSLLYRPFPDSAALAKVFRVRTIGWEGGPSRAHLEFPARRNPGNQPIWSPDGKRVAFDAAHEIYLTQTGPEDEGQRIQPDPNVPVTGRSKVGTWGGIFPRWRDPATLEFAAGHRYVSHQPATGKTEAIEIRLKVPRPKPAGSVALVGAKIITIDSGGVIDQGTIVVRGSRIACVGQCDTAGVDRVLDVRGKTIIPGLVDLHAHHTTEAAGAIIPQHRPESALDLAYGVTTIVDPATNSESALTLAELIEAGALTGPRTFSSTEFVIAHGIAWGDYHEIDSLADATAMVDRRAEWGAVTIKNYRQPGRRQHQLIAEAARRRGISLTSEGGPLYLDVGYAIDGQTGWEHMIADLPVYQDATTFFGMAGLVYSPTLIVAGVPHGSMEYFRPRADLLNEARTRRFMPYPILAAKVKSARLRSLDEVAFPIMAEAVADIVKAGGHAAIGEHGEQVGLGSHWELWAYATGLTPVAAIKIATWDGAYFIGAHQEIGSIKVGKLADLAILDADPMVDIKNSAKVAMTMKAGRLYQAATLDELWPGRTPYGRIPWPTSGAR